MSKYSKEKWAKGKDVYNSKRRDKYKLNPDTLKLSQVRLARWQGGILGYLKEYKLGVGCVICGYNKYAGALHFHHIDRSTKNFALGNTRAHVGVSMESVKCEVKKCVVICSNCHAELHAKLISLPCEFVLEAS
jgi:hypothetical protein